MCVRERGSENENDRGCDRGTKGERVRVRVGGDVKERERGRE